MEPSTEKSAKTAPTGVAVDGQRLRTIREEKRLTQLYVANVVGVTTDTISRWENNRYPSIKRENAEKLALALEVPLADIVRQEEAEPEPPAVPARSHRRLVLYLLVGAVLLVAAGTAAYRLLHLPLSASRRLPSFTPPGEVVPVQLKVGRKGGAQQGFIIRERLPSGWRLVGANPPPSPGHDQQGELKWLIPGGSGPVTISYTAAPPADVPLRTQATFAGSIVVHSGGMGRTEETGGSRTVTVATCHWADVNCDGRIDDNEIMPAYYLTEEMKGLGLDWNTIETVWSGRGYRWDERSRRFEVTN